MHAASDLIDTLLHPSPSILISNLGVNNTEALYKLEETINTAVLQPQMTYPGKIPRVVQTPAPLHRVKATLQPTNIKSPDPPPNTHRKSVNGDTILIIPGFYLPQPSQKAPHIIPDDM